MEKLLSCEEAASQISDEFSNEGKFIETKHLSLGFHVSYTMPSSFMYISICS